MIIMLNLYCDKKFCGLLQEEVKRTYSDYVGINTNLELEYCPVNDEITVDLPFGEMSFYDIDLEEEAYCIYSYQQIAGKKVFLEPIRIKLEQLECYNVPEYEMEL